jgi:putative ABC transport system permease protein
MDSLRLDLEFAFRTLRRNALFTLSAGATIAIGIGAATAMFGVVRGVLLKPLPIRDQASVVVLRKEQLVGNNAVVPFNVNDLREYAATTRTLSAVAGAQYDGAWPVTLRDGDRALSPLGTVASGDFFRVLGVRAVIGRTLDASDDVAGATRVCVISYSYWQREFAGDSAVVGRMLYNASSGGAIRIVGVIPAGFVFPGRADVWVPTLAFMPADGQWPYSFVGRLRPGASLEQARQELAGYLARKSYAPGEPRDVRASARSIESLIVGDVRPALLALGGAVALLLIIANVNVANLLIVRSIARRGELAVRSAIGAGRGRLVQQLLTEGLVLATLGGIAGTALAFGLLHLLVVAAPAGLPRIDEIRIDPIVLGAAAAMVILSALVFGVWPALGVTRQSDLGRALRSGGRGVAARTAGGTRSVLAVTQIALALVMLVGAGLIVRTLANLQRLDLGFAAPELRTFQMTLPDALTSSRPRLTAFYDRATARLASEPGFTAATVSILPPFSGENGWDAFYAAEGQVARDVAVNPPIDFQAVLPSYFATMGIPILRGRAISASDHDSSARVVVVSDALARRTWPGADPIGKRIKFGAVDAPGPWHTVVGVVPDVRYRELTNPRPVVFTAWMQQTQIPALGFMLVRGQPSQPLALADVRRVLRDIEPGVLVSGMSTIKDHLTTSLARPRFNAALLGAFAVTALLLSAVGVYGVIAALVRERTQEFGIRLALGAPVGHVRRVVLRRGLALGGIGVAVGLVVSLASSGVLRGLLYGVTPTDVGTLAVASGLLMTVAVVACWIPVRAATSIDPLVALRADY